jgi:cation diffusion facilitator CzcD-associated flavoprotein CzcO
MTDQATIIESPSNQVEPERAGATEFLDVLIVGAGLSGIGAGYHLQSRCRGMSYAILEAREAIGGTWDLFRYPGIRSDSDMYTLGYSFRPWGEGKSIAGGSSILNYVRETAREFGIDERIRFKHRVRQASWSSAKAQWLVEAERVDTGEIVRLACGFLVMCSGYYSYAGGHAPEFPGAERFQGRIVHPQFWPEDLNYAGKRVVVIGSGATAVTIVPEMAKTAAHVTMLQRSPTYIVSRPSEDKVANWLRERLPAKLAYRLTRLKNMALGMHFYRLARKYPEKTKQQIIAMARHALGPDYDVATHFTPSYNPWDQRLCLVPDSDLFAAIRNKQASVATGHIETFTETGIRLRSGAEIEADIVVTATGLKVNLLGDVGISVDGSKVDLSKALAYKGMMFSGVPNLAWVIGYTNASWTLKADITCEYMCRLLNHMRRRGYVSATPRHDPSAEGEPFFGLTSGYVQRGLHLMPKQGSKRPWKLHRNYAMDAVALRFGRVADGTMEFARR